MMMKVVVEMLLKKMTTLTTQEEELERNREAEAERQRREVLDLSSFLLSPDSLIFPFFLHCLLTR